MSRSKRARAKERKRVEARPRASRVNGESSRLAPARRRAELAKVAVAIAAVVCVAASMALARVTYAGHAKHPVSPLSIPQPLYRVVRQNLLQAGILAPATAPPDATTSTS
jgi:putative heme iron utilization protein